MSLKKIYNIEALRRKIGCQTYEELETLYGYDVSGYFQNKAKNHSFNNETYFHYEDDETSHMNFSNPSRPDYMGT